jgi:nicotinamidase/pyrazinamidase
MQATRPASTKALPRESGQPKIRLAPGDALIVVDVQRDFLPGGSLAVPLGDEVIPILNEYIRRFEEHGLPIFATRDWHPADHCSFQAQGGPWPVHCVMESEGARFPSALTLSGPATVISKASRSEQESYSDFAGTDLEARLDALGARRLFIGGLATDYCVLHTVKDALQQRFQVFLLHDAIRAINVHPGDGQRAEQEMMQLGAKPVELKEIV